MNTTHAKTIGVLVFDDVEELDFVGPFEVFGMAAEFGAACRTFVIGEIQEAVRCAHGLRVLPDYTIDEAPRLDLLIVPGGRGARLHARHDPKILGFVREQKGIVASVCTGALVLASAGLLDGLEATTHYSRFEMLREYDSITVREDALFVMHDRIATSAGVTAGIDLALALVTRLWSKKLAEKIAANLEWHGSDWREWSKRTAGSARSQ